MRKVLIVDDDPHIREVVSFALSKAGFETAEAEDGAQAIERFEAVRPDLVVLDILMPEMDGTDVCRELRRRSAVPVVFLTSKDDELDRVIGLELGGDDYVTKPFRPRELVARVRAVLRRTAGPRAGDAPAAPAVLEHGRLRLDVERFRAWWGKREVALTATEFGIVRALAARPGKVFTRDDLMSRAYDDEVFVSGRTIDSHVRRVRAKFAAAGGDPIETVHGVGYRLGPC